MKNFGEKVAWVYPGTCQIFWVPSIISGTGKATEFKCGQYIHGVYPIKSPLKILENRDWEHGRIQGLPNFSGSLPSIISGTGEAMNFKFCVHIYRLDRNKSPLKTLGKVAVGAVIK